MNRTFLLTLCAALLPLSFSARADDASEAKKSEQLKSVMQQLRTAQTEKSTMQAAQAQLEAKNKTLEEQVKKQAKSLEDLDKEMKAAKETSERIQGEHVNGERDHEADDEIFVHGGVGLFARLAGAGFDRELVDAGFANLVQHLDGRAEEAFSSPAMRIFGSSVDDL